MAKSRGGGEEGLGAAGREPQTEVVFDYLKSNLFRVVYVDGAFGGLGPSGRSLHMAIFSERRALPRRVVHLVSPSGVVGEELRERREVRSDVVRELEADLVMDLSTAIAIHKWLGEKINEMAMLHHINIDDLATQARL